jgi:C4-dicarboxylate-specific signal transduction histidine kinase
MSEPREVAFVGRVTAGFTHELKNVLAIIKESAGLMEDLLALSKEGSFPHQERFGRAISGILKQVGRGVELTSRLNRFAHSTDVPVLAVDLREITVQLTLLAERFARLKGVVLKAEGSEESLVVSTSPVRLQMALLTGMECCWEAMTAGGEVVLRAERAGAEAAVVVDGRGRSVEEPDWMIRVERSSRWKEVGELVSSLGGRLEPAASGRGFAVLLPREPA